MGGNAKYTIMVPRVEHAPQLAQVAHEALVNGPIPLHHAYLDPGKLAHWPNEEPQVHDLLVAYSEDTPEMDSHIKQLGREVGRLGQLPAVFALKEGKQGIARWSLDNPELQAGQA